MKDYVQVQVFSPEESMQTKETQIKVPSKEGLIKQKSAQKSCAAFEGIVVIN